MTGLWKQFESVEKSDETYMEKRSRLQELEEEILEMMDWDCFDELHIGTNVIQRTPKKGNKI